MSMKAGTIAVAALLVPGLSLPAMAQDEDYRTIVTIMRACAQIEDITARVTCYDNNIAPRGPAMAAAVPPPSAAPPPVPVPAARGFGAEMVPQVREERRSEQAEEVELTVSAARQVQPGIHQLTLSDGAEWVFVDATSYNYAVPGRGDRVRLERGSLGSVLLHFDGQRGVRVRRIR